MSVLVSYLVIHDVLISYNLLTIHDVNEWLWSDSNIKLGSR